MTYPKISTARYCALYQNRLGTFGTLIRTPENLNFRKKNLFFNLGHKHCQNNEKDCRYFFPLKNQPKTVAHPYVWTIHHGITAYPVTDYVDCYMIP